ncbi:MAG: TIGR03960 family B12-binding radical SAM protein [candidate division Zixibacteria bacterium]|nr:TIGR03960 family B12-binding radical SAM protein [candidate division Zixibacteria bacterium]
MRTLLEKKLFPFVIKPGRYTGGEPGQIVKDPEGRLNYLHAYPDKYELGQSYLGLQTIYHIINSDDRFLCERVYAVDTDTEEIMRREKIPLFSLESSRPAMAFDAVGFTLVDESVYTNLLTMLDLGGIPLHTADRDNRHPLVMAGGPSVYNPEPLADFIDLFFIGDGEEGLPQILEILLRLKGQSRAEKLEAIGREVESVYIPEYYDCEHNPLNDFAPPKIKARLVRSLKPEYYPEQPLVPLIEPVHNHLGVEIMRGCPQGCRFCMAGPIYRPVRIRPKADITNQVEQQINHSGYEEVSLMSLSSADYPDIETLATTLARRLETRKVSIALPSLRPGTIGPALLDAVRRVRNYGLTFAPEAGSERLRAFIRKNFPDEAIYDTARMAFQRGWTTVKLYFMVGLPTETDEDLQGIVNLCRQIQKIGREYPGKKTINVSISPFIPKPFTPFQWDEAVDEREAYRRILFVKKKLNSNQIHIKHEDTKLSQVLAVLSRGGREMGAVIETVYKNGGRFDHWTENFKYDLWVEAFEKNNVSITEALRAVPFTRNLPWSHIEKGASIEHLQKERQRTSAQLMEYVPLALTADEEQAAANNNMEFGRGKKKVASRNLAAPTKNRFRIRWGKTTRYKYMSHLDNLRMLERSIRIARLPVAYSQGFNPTMKLSFGPPLPLGFTSEAEYVDITLDTNFMPYMLESLQKALPEGINIFDARAVLGKAVSLSAALNRVEYCVPVEEWADKDDLNNNLKNIMNAEKLETERTGKNDTKRVDIRPAIYELKIEGDILVMTLGLGEGGYTRPTEVTEFLGENLINDPVALPYHRRAMYRFEEDRKIDPMDI